MMLFVWTLAATFLAACFGIPAELSNPVSSDYHTFEVWMKHFGISYDTDEITQEKYQVWSDRVQAIKV